MTSMYFTISPSTGETILDHTTDDIDEQFAATVSKAVGSFLSNHKTSVEYQTMTPAAYAEFLDGEYGITYCDTGVLVDCDDPSFGNFVERFGKP